jgi:hypothetical protein
VTLIVALASGVTAIVLPKEFGIAEGFMITLLGLLAADALIERMSHLEKISERLDEIQTRPQLRPRTELRHPAEWVMGAREIDVLAVSACYLLSYGKFFEDALRSGASLRFLLLEPSCNSMDTWELMSRTKSAKSDVGHSLEILSDLGKYKKGQGSLSVRLSETLMPFSLFIVNPGSSNSSILAELHALKIRIDERPHIRLDRETSPHWCDFFVEQFETCWLDAKPYPLEPSGASRSA